MSEGSAAALLACSSFAFIGAMTGYLLCEFGWKPWSDEARAARERDRRRSALIIEYLGYGYDHGDAIGLAEAKMKQDAQKARESVESTLGAK